MTSRSASTIEQRLADQRARNELAQETLRGRMLRAQLAATSGRVGPSATYRNATRTRVRPGPIPSGGSAQKHLRYAVRSNLRRDCQDLQRNSLVARVAVKRLADLLIASGAVVESTSRDPAWNRLADEAWIAYADATMPDVYGHPDVRRRATYWQLLRQAISAFATDGDVLQVFTRDGSLQFVESERIVSPSGVGYAQAISAAPQAGQGGSLIIDGVECSRVGTPIAYHVAEWDASGGSVVQTSRRVSADAAVLLVNPLDEKIGLVRGEPALQAAIERIERLDNYVHKTGLAAEIATLFGLVVTDEAPGEIQSAFEAGTGNQPAKANADEPNEIELQAATVQFMRRGGQVTQVKPEYPTTNYRDYVTTEMGLILADMGIPLPAAVFDASGMSWSNIKALLAMSMRSLEAAQDYLVSATIRRTRNFTIRRLIAEGLLPDRDDCDSCHVTMPAAPVVDFKSEVEGHVLAVNNLLETRDQATQAMGTGRASDIRFKRSLEARAEANLGVTPPMTPGATTSGAPGNQQGNA